MHTHRLLTDGMLHAPTVHSSAIYYTRVFLKQMDIPWKLSGELQTHSSLLFSSLHLQWEVQQQMHANAVAIKQSKPICDPGAS